MALTIYSIAKLSYESFDKRFLRLKERFKAGIGGRELAAFDVATAEITKVDK